MADLRQCPYNKAHKTLIHRFHTHLIKCREANPHLNLEICPYNATHHVPDMQLHLEECEDKISVDVNKYFSATAHKRYAKS